VKQDGRNKHLSNEYRSVDVIVIALLKIMEWYFDCTLIIFC